MNIFIPPENHLLELTEKAKCMAESANATLAKLEEENNHEKMKARINHEERTQGYQEG